MLLRLVIALAIVALTLAVHYLLLHRTKHPQPVAHITTHLWWHVPVPILWLLLAAGLGIGYEIEHGLGALYTSRLHVKPPLSLVREGQRAGTDIDLSAAMPTVQDEGTSNACGSFAVTEALYAQRVLRGERPPWAAFSGWYTYAYATGGTSTGDTSIERNIAAVNAHGVVRAMDQPAIGAPSALTQADAVGSATQTRLAFSPTTGASSHYLFYRPDGRAGLDAIRGALAGHQVVIVLLSANDDLFNAFGHPATNNSGASHGYHFMVIDAAHGDEFQARNSWGTGFGEQGSIWLTEPAMLTTVVAAATVDPGPILWPPLVAHPAHTSGQTPASLPTRP